MIKIEKQSLVYNTEVLSNIKNNYTLKVIYLKGNVMKYFCQVT